MSRDPSFDVYDKVCLQRPDLIKSLTDAIDKHVDGLNTVRGDQAGCAILPDQEGFTEFCGDASLAGRVFGIAMREHLKDLGWNKYSVTEFDKVVTYYTR